MLGRGSSRRRDGGYRFDALALQRHEQSETKVAQRHDPVHMTDHLVIERKSKGASLSCVQLSISTRRDHRRSPTLPDLPHRAD